MNDLLNPTHGWEPRARYRPSNAQLRRIRRFTIGAVFFGAALSVATSVALSQGTEGTAEQREACTPDAIRLCNTFIPDADRVKECLMQHIAALNLRCRELLGNNRKSGPTSASGSLRKSN